MRIHVIGVGGSGMSAVAHLLAAQGHAVTGSDQAESKYFKALAQAGLEVSVGHDPSRVDAADVVVVSTAIRDTNEELARAREQGIEVWHRSEALARAVAGKRVVAVAGSHGKTTTAALVTHLLHASAIDATAAVGAALKGVPGAVAGGYAGTSEIAVLEADESDGSFLRYVADVAVVTNIEPDHMDYYGTVDRLHQAFGEFMRHARMVVACGDDPVVRDLATRHGGQVLWYGTADADLEVAGQSLTWAGVTYPWVMPTPGLHYQLNAAAALAAAVSVGADPQVCAQALPRFGGTGRRFELRAEVGGVRIIDDYAHHPTEVAALLRGARDGGAEHLVVVFEPMLFTRTQLHARAFGEALSVDNADVVLAPVHGDREDPIPGVTSASIAAAIRPGTASVVLSDSLADAAAQAARLARPGSTILTVGSGPVTTLAPIIAEHLRAQENSDA